MTISYVFSKETSPDAHNTTWHFPSPGTLDPCTMELPEGHRGRDHPPAPICQNTKKPEKVGGGPPCSPFCRRLGQVGYTRGPGASRRKGSPAEARLGTVSTKTAPLIAGAPPDTRASHTPKASLLEAENQMAGEGGWNRPFPFSNSKVTVKRIFKTQINPDPQEQ